jgi:hypothetical protein
MHISPSSALMSACFAGAQLADFLRKCDLCDVLITGCELMTLPRRLVAEAWPVAQRSSRHNSSTFADIFANKIGWDVVSAPEQHGS